MTTPPPQGNPFAQGQPQGQNPFAQGQPQAPHGQQPGFPQQGAYAPAPAQPRRKLSFKTIKNIVIVIAVATAAIGGFIASRDDANTAAVGDCMHRGSSDDNNPDLEVVDCADSKAEYVVLAKVEGSYSALTAESKCAEEAKDFQYSYTESGDGSDFLLCLKDYKK
ncbi:LppU/SCO3897 family protein [Streptomyces sp. MN13]